MIRSIDVQNFRCYSSLRVESCSRLNVIVGDNGSGKTALLESIFLPLSTSTEVAMRLRRQRGIDSGPLTGSARRIEDAIWGDFFYKYDTAKPIVLTLAGAEQESRSLVISRGSSEHVLPLSDDDSESTSILSPVVFTWKDSIGREYQVIPKITAGRIHMPDTGEDMPDFFYFAANQTISSVENASRFSELSKARHHTQFVELFSKEYPIIEDINVEVSAGAPLLYVSMSGMDDKIPLANVSGGINRIVGIMLAIASRSKSVVLVDEIENGLFYKHHTAIWRGLLSFMRGYDSQLFITTHSQECLDALAEAVESQVDDIALWRIERAKQQPVIHQFKGRQVVAGIRAGEIR